MTLIERIFEEMTNDDTDDSERLRALYEGSDANTRAVMDAVLICLCGWSFKTLLEDSK